jgi:hypothetical protein
MERRDSAVQRTRKREWFWVVVLGVVVLVALASGFKTSTKVLVGGWYLASVLVFVLRGPK